MWSTRDEDGVYDKAFGVNEVLEDVWGSDTIAEARLAIAVYWNIAEDFKDRGRKDPSLKFLHRLRFHALALAARHTSTEVDPSEYSDVVATQKAFESLYESAWGPMRSALVLGHQRALADEVTLFALARSDERWTEISDTFDKLMKVL